MNNYLARIVHIDTGVGSVGIVLCAFNDVEFGGRHSVIYQTGEKTLLHSSVKYARVNRRQRVQSHELKARESNECSLVLGV